MVKTKGNSANNIDIFNYEIIKVHNLVKHFELKYSIADAISNRSRKRLTAVDGVSFAIKSGETFGLVGESGCGKSTLARTILRLYEPSSGEIYYGDLNTANLSEKEIRLKRRQFQMIFQNPYSPLNPKLTVRKMLSEILNVHKICEKKDTDRRIFELLKMVGLGESAIDRFPSEFSGGQRQRIGIARALAIEPHFIIADEPVSALDVSIQAQIINLLIEIQQKKSISFLFISHDLRIVRLIAHRVAVMYLGVFVEIAPTEELYNNPHHPYTKLLMQSVPLIAFTNRNREYTVENDNLVRPSELSGCRFKPRCPYSNAKCETYTPELIEISAGRFVACHHPL